MGHSFGCVVVSSILGGPEGHGPLCRPIDSTVLVQGAVSLWSYASSISFAGAGPGYFHRILADGNPHSLLADPDLVLRSCAVMENRLLNACAASISEYRHAGSSLEESGWRFLSPYSEGNLGRTAGKQTKLEAFET
jgi:hypothetical protein